MSLYRFVITPPTKPGSLMHLVVPAATCRRQGPAPARQPPAGTGFVIPGCPAALLMCCVAHAGLPPGEVLRETGVRRVVTPSR
jgi:hypothetical protein